MARPSGAAGENQGLAERRGMNNREIILRCMEVNADYMRLPAGMLQEYRSMVNLYQRSADQLKECAQAGVEDKPCPAHEPATDGFIWAVVSWAEAFGQSIGVDMEEWDRVFVAPHDQFASYLKPRGRSEWISPVAGSPAQIVMELDARWTDLVIRLTIRFGIKQHLKDRKAMIEARHLQQELRKEGSPVYKAYLQSDLAFFKQLFKNFPFSEKTVMALGDWLLKLEEAV